MNNINSTIRFSLALVLAIVFASILGSSATDTMSVVLMAMSALTFGVVVNTGIESEEKEIEIIAMAKKYHSENI